MHYPNRPFAGRLTTLASLALLALGACTDATTVGPATSGASPQLSESAAEIGGVFVTTNATEGNAVVAFARGVDGALAPAGTFSTGGRGTGGGTDPLASQFALVLSEDAGRLYTVNAGSNSISTFAVSGAELTLLGTVASGGEEPISLALSRGRLFVLNAASNSVAEFALGADGTPVAQPVVAALGNAASGASTIRVSPDGRAVLVTERAANAIEVFPLAPDGRLSAPISSRSSGSTPFGFGVTRRGQAVISEASGAVSSYALNPDGSLTPISASVSAHQAATCWLAVTPSGRFAYAANAGSGSLSGYAVGADGSLRLLDADGRTGVTGNGSAPLDLGLSRNGRFLYVLEAGTGAIGAFAVAADGHLAALPAASGLAPASGLQGLAAY